MNDAQQIVEAIPNPAMLISLGERVLAANERAVPLFGKDLAGRHLLVVLRQPSVLDAIESCRKAQKQRTTRYLTSDGRQDVTYIVTCSYLGLAGVTGVLIVFEDITQLEQAGQMRRDFVANVSHELRTPLTALLGFIETLQGPARDDEKARDRFLGIMAKEADRMSRLVRDLLSLSAVEGQERIRPVDRIDIVALVQETKRTLQHLADDGGVVIEDRLPDRTVMLSGDADQLRQVVTNLIENAIKYGGPGCTVGLSMEGPATGLGLRGSAIKLTVSDTGKGIDTAHISRLTERFYRVDSHRSRQMGGTGLGLAIVKHIVNRHRGRLRIESTLGKGSQFSVILPVLE